MSEARPPRPQVTRPRSAASRGRAILAGTALGVAVVAGLAIGVAGRAASSAGAEAFAGPLGPCRVDDVLTPHRDTDDWARTLLDTEFRLAADDVPPDLTPIDDPRVAGDGSLRAFVLEDLGALAADAAAAGAPFRITSAYRSHAQQVRTFESLVAAYGRDEALRAAARPGHSEHQLGTTIDTEGGEAWLADEAWRYGFIVSYPFEHSPDTTCYKAEPWHLRYIGRDAAADVRVSGVSLRAWLWSRQVDD